MRRMEKAWPVEKVLSWTLVLLLITSICPGRRALAEETISREYKVKAALVYNFARFTQWPDQALAGQQDAFKVVVFGDRGVTWDFNAIAGRKVAGRTIEIAFTRNPLEVRGCQILFLVSSERELWPQVLAALDEEPVLTIGEMNGFLESGGILNLVNDEGRISFQVNLDHAREHQISISSRILKLAAKVIGGKKGEIH